MRREQRGPDESNGEQLREMNIYQLVLALETSNFIHNYGDLVKHFEKSLRTA